MAVLRALAGVLLLVAVVLVPGCAAAEQPANQTARELPAPAGGADVESQLAGGVALAGLGGLVVFGLRRIGTRGNPSA